MSKIGFLSFRRNVSQVILVGEKFFRSVGTFDVLFTDPKEINLMGTAAPD